MMNKTAPAILLFLKNNHIDFFLFFLSQATYFPDLILISSSLLPCFLLRVDIEYCINLVGKCQESGVRSSGDDLINKEPTNSVMLRD